MNQRCYKGRLYYDDSTADYVDALSFIVRQDEVAYSLDSVGKAHGRWTAESGKPARLQQDGTFLATNVMASRLGVRVGAAWTIIFKIEHETLGEAIEVSGSIEEAGAVSTFGGELLSSH